ncbi:unnamed protein product [Rhizophagus irregularis]|nr:unnamed protein product [Rhizophagus irregularis]CAB4408380.1 unnamed protein product [Rhizophagus irregularis]
MLIPRSYRIWVKKFSRVNLLISIEIFATIPSWYSIVQDELNAEDPIDRLININNMNVHLHYHLIYNK